MPLLYYLCNCTHHFSKFFRHPTQAPPILACEKCNKEAKKQLKAPNSTSVLTIDNGIQAKSVEINPDIIESNIENSTKDFHES